MHQAENREPAAPRRGFVTIFAGKLRMRTTRIDDGVVVNRRSLSS
jgi:hypothetical protein